jgi:hypothetical protein
MRIILAEIPLEKLIPGVSRPQSWIDKHPNYLSMQNKMINDIKKRGLKYPLTCSNIKDDGSYVVNVGNQRLDALIAMGAKTARCLVACTDTQENIPDGEVISSKEIPKLFDWNIKNICLIQTIFQVVPGDVDIWDPDKQYLD